MYIMHHQMGLLNTFDRTTEICSILIQASKSLLTFAYIIDSLLHILKKMCYAFDQTQKSHTIEVNLVLHPSHSFSGQLQNILHVFNKLDNVLMIWAQTLTLLHKERQWFSVEMRWTCWE